MLKNNNNNNDDDNNESRGTRFRALAKWLKGADTEGNVSTSSDTHCRLFICLFLNINVHFQAVGHLHNYSLPDTQTQQPARCLRSSQSVKR